MDGIDTTLVEHIAQLSRLSLTNEEVTSYTHDLAAILDYASRLPVLSATAEAASLRLAEDEVRPFPHPEKLLVNAIDQEQGFVKVPAILDKTDV